VTTNVGFRRCRLPRDNLQTSIDDSALATRARTGDLAAFNALVETHQDAVYGLCLRMLASSHAAEDVTQDVFLAAYRRIDSYRGGVFRAWLLRIAANACTDELRRRRRRPQVSLDEATGDGSPLDLPDESESPEESVLRGELSRYIQAGLMALPPDQRAAVVLCDVQGLSYEEVSAALHVSLGTVKSRLSRGRARLRDLLLRQRELLPHPFRHTV
jgi:RNA polymerase sigma-70 factor (ECF subfamily)